MMPQATPRPPAAGRLTAVVPPALAVLLAAAGLLAGMLVPAPTARAATAPTPLAVDVLDSYPHDVNAFTEGLERRGGVLYESTGMYGQSELRTVAPSTGEVRQRIALADNFFGEGITVVGNRIWQLTYVEGTAFLRDRSTLEEIRRVTYPGQGWGLCNDQRGRRLVMSDGSDRLTFRDPETFEPLGSVPVTLDGVPLNNINELECVDGMVWANVWLTDRIVRIDPASGKVDATVDATGLLTDAERLNADVLNGIATGPYPGTFYVTGKYWPHIFLVRFTRQR